MSSKKTSDDDKKESLSQSLNVIDPKKHPGAAAVNEALNEAKENKTYFNEDKRGRPQDFKAGQIKPKKLTLVEELADRLGIENNNKIFSNLILAATTGEIKCDLGAAMFFMKRLFPKGKAPRHIRSSIRDLITLADIDTAQTQIFREVVNGEMDIDDAKDLFSMTHQKSELRVRTITEEIEARLDLLEQGVK